MILNINILSVLFLFFCAITPGNSQDYLVPASSLSATSYVIAANNNVRKPIKRDKRDKRDKQKRNSKKAFLKHINTYFPIWRNKHEINFLKKEARKKAGYLKHLKVIREGIIAHEGGIHNGHTILKHVGVSTKSLIKRIKYEKAKRAKHDKNVDHKDLTMDQFSSFKNLKEANILIDTVLYHKRNRHKIKNWIIEYKKFEQIKKIKNKSENKKKSQKRSGEKSGEKIEKGKEKENERELYQDNNIDVSLNNFKKSTGLAVDPKTKKSIDPKGVMVRLIIDKNNARGWSILRAFPIK